MFLRAASCMSLELLRDWPLPGVCEVLGSFDAVSPSALGDSLS
jgi:hypothetical protein